ncbi:hypothetical protein BD289DRAFT_142389 [Coniella lustricola]|uniref:Heterokaryon incompatibility domain-containing protein n=1 Tax=Coniella lustricola TaxID=2025994 RepID=A0A2T2ZV74_9PEZI|nr:hypothetical protein BD289DRAFT_142389 [Coniella lustricola]
MSFFQTPEFRYSPLPSPTSIRLLRIYRTRNSVLPSLCGYPLIRCSLEVVDLLSESAPAYEALSYTWDSPETEFQKRKTDNWKDPYGPLGRWPVDITDSATGARAILYVRKNLFDALLHLQRLDGIDATSGDFDKTKLHDAAESGDDEVTRTLLDQGASCGARDCFGETPLHYAAENGHYEVVKLLVAAGADMNVFDKKGRLPVQCCLQRKQGEWENTARFLRDIDFRSQELYKMNGGSLNIDTRIGPLLKTPLILAAENGNLNDVLDLVRRGASLSAQAKFGKTALHHAAGNGYYEIVRELVRAGASLEILDKEKRTPLLCSEQMRMGDWEKITRFLRDQAFRQEELSSVSSTQHMVEPELKGSASGLFWIDALCINQGDLEERSAQVRIMPQIYSKADCVIVWLGDDSDMLFRLLRNVWINPDLKQVIKTVNRKAKKLKELEKQWRVSLGMFLVDEALDWIVPDGGIFDINDIRLILGTFLRSWFTRVWCIQELSLAKNIRMFLGKTELDWHEVLKFLCLLAHVGFFRPSSLWKMDKGWIMQDGTGGDSSEAWRLAEIRLRTTGNSEEWDIINPILHRKHCKAPHIRKSERLSLPLLIAATWSFQSKDPRDKIYAILSLAAPLPPKDEINIDYTSPVEDLYTQVGHIFLRGSLRDSMYIRGNALAGILEPLEGLSYVQDPYYSGQQARMPGLPTWAPNFSIALSTDRIWRREFSTAKALQPEFGPGDKPETLQVLGVIVDSVDMVEPGWADLANDDMPPDLEIDVQSWLDLLETIPSRLDESPAQMLFRTLCMDRLWKDCDKASRIRNAASFRDFMAWELAHHIRKGREKEENEDEGAKGAQSRESESESEDDTENDAQSGDDVSQSERGDSDDDYAKICDDCERDIVAGDWRCADCEDSDYCWQCFGKATHDPNHRFLSYRVSPAKGVDPFGSQQTERTMSQLLSMFQIRHAGLKHSILPHENVKRHVSGLSRWFSHGDAKVEDNPASSQGSAEDFVAPAVTASQDGNDASRHSASSSGLQSSLLESLNHQRSIEAASGSETPRFLPSTNEIPPPEKLTGAIWQWCKYHGDPACCKKLDDETSFRFQMVRVYRKRVLFRTQGGRLGLGPQSLRPGDNITLLAGTRTPYILRPRREGPDNTIVVFKFMGEAYVHGIMYGEAASKLQRDSFVKIHLE